MREFISQYFKFSAILTAEIVNAITSNGKMYSIFASMRFVQEKFRNIFTEIMFKKCLYHVYPV